MRSLAVCTLLISLIASNAFARTESVDANVIRVLVSDEERWGGCMILINKSITDQGLDCGLYPWVSFSCSGDFNTKQAAGNMLDSAKMALALDMKLRLEITDTQKHNGACVAKRVDVFR